MSVARAHGRPSVNSSVGFCFSPVSLTTTQGFLCWVLFLIPTLSLGQWLRFLLLPLTLLSPNISHLRTYHFCLTDASHIVNAPKVLSEWTNAQPLNLLSDYFPSPNPKLQSHCYFSFSACDLFLPLAPTSLYLSSWFFSPRFLDSVKGNTILCFLFIWSCLKPCNVSMTWGEGRDIPMLGLAGRFVPDSLWTTQTQNFKPALAHLYSFPLITIQSLSHVAFVPKMPRTSFLLHFSGHHLSPGPNPTRGAWSLVTVSIWSPYRGCPCLNPSCTLLLFLNHLLPVQQSFRPRSLYRELNPFTSEMRRWRFGEVNCIIQEGHTATHSLPPQPPSIAA